MDFDLLRHIRNAICRVDLDIIQTHHAGSGLRVESVQDFNRFPQVRVQNLDDVLLPLFRQQLDEIRDFVRIQKVQDFRKRVVPQAGHEFELNVL